MNPNEPLSDDDAPKQQSPSSPDAHDAPEQPEKPGRFSASRLEVEALRAMYRPAPPPAPEDEDDDVHEPPGPASP